MYQWKNKYTIQYSFIINKSFFTSVYFGILGLIEGFIC